MKKRHPFSKSKTGTIYPTIVRLVLFSLLVGVIQFYVQSGQAEEATTRTHSKPTLFRAIVKKEHRDNVLALKKFLATMEADSNKIKEYARCLDSVMAARSREPANPVMHSEWQRNAWNTYYALDANARQQINDFISKLPVPCLSLSDLELLDFSSRNSYTCTSNPYFAIVAMDTTTGCCTISGPFGTYRCCGGECDCM